MNDAPVALVTGAARGIGASVVRRLLARGFVVHALDSCAGTSAGTTYPLATRADLDAVVALDPEHVVPSSPTSATSPRSPTPPTGRSRRTARSTSWWPAPR